MKAISLWQPWASLIACGAKPYETRSWPPPQELIGETIAIHAAKKIEKGAAEFAEELMYGQYEPGGFDLADKLEASMEGAHDEQLGIFGHAVMPIGCVVCIARLVAAFQVRDLLWPEGAAHALAVIGQRRTLGGRFAHVGDFPTDDFGDYAIGRWAWLLRDVQPLNPPATMKGRQGFFELPQGWLTGAAA